MRLAAVTLFLAVAALGSSTEIASPRSATAAELLYTSYWSGRSQVYAVAAGGQVSQLTFGAYPCGADVRCGVSSVVPAPGGRRLLLETSAPGQRLLVTNADGSGRRPVGVIGASGGVWSHDAERIAYTAVDGVHVMRRDGTMDRRIGSGNSPRWSPRGDALAFLHLSGSAQSLVIWKPTATRVVMTTAVQSCCAMSFAWSPDGRRFAVAGSGLSVISANGERRRVLTTTEVSSVRWSHDAHHIAWSGPGGLVVADVDKHQMRTIFTPPPYAPLWWAWSPDGTKIAYATPDIGLWVTSVGGGAARRLSPDGGSLYWTPDNHGIAVYDGRGGLQVVSLAGDVRTLLAPAQATVVPPSLGRDIDNDFVRIVGWTRPPAGTVYRRPAAPSPARDLQGTLIAPWTITKVATSGERIAFAACGHVFVWTPSDRAVSQMDGDRSLAPNCSNGYYNLFDLGLADGRVAYGEVEGGNSQAALLSLRNLGTDGTTTVLDGANSTGPSFPNAVGQLAGDGSLLVYGNWTNSLTNGVPSAVTSETVHLAGASGCPCPVLATRADGALAPLDVDAGRILVSRGDELDLLSASGTLLLTLPIAATDGALSGNELVATAGSELRVYDAATGSLDHTWPLPEAATPRCRAPRCTIPPTGAVLAGAADGQAAYIVAGVLHLIRLDSGAEVFTAASNAAAFFDGGLAYASGDELRILPFIQPTIPLKRWRGLRMGEGSRSSHRTPTSPGITRSASSLSAVITPCTSTAKRSMPRSEAWTGRRMASGSCSIPLAGRVRRTPSSKTTYTS